MMKMRSPWLSLFFIVLVTTSCGFPHLSKGGSCPAADDAGNDDVTCYNTALFNPPLTICLPSISTDVYPFDTSSFDTDDSSLCMPTVTGADDYYVIAANTIIVNTTVRAKGHRPLMLIARDSILIDHGGVIDVGSHRMPDEWIGAGADSKDCMSGMTLPSGSQGGGGAGGSFIGSGGSGGDGAGIGSGSGGTAGSGAATPVPGIRGGCAGQDGGGDFPGPGGHGGGAVFLISNGDIRVNGAILAGGEGGGGGVTTGSGMTKHSGGGGGGAGGMIGLDAPSVSVTGLLVANGGGGGEGAGSPPNDPHGNGGAGHDATAAAPACGGTGGTKDAGGGGCGSPGCKHIEESCTPSAPPTTSGSDGYGGGSNSGGGGGGGGAGLIKVPHLENLGGQVSPPAT